MSFIKIVNRVKNHIRQNIDKNDLVIRFYHHSFTHTHPPIYKFSYVPLCSKTREFQVGSQQ